MEDLCERVTGASFEPSTVVLIAAVRVVPGGRSTVGAEPIGLLAVSLYERQGLACRWPGADDEQAAVAALEELGYVGVAPVDLHSVGDAALVVVASHSDLPARGGWAWNHRLLMYPWTCEPYAVWAALGDERNADALARSASGTSATLKQVLSAARVSTDRRQ